jgi:hypothetical protein
MNLIDRILNHEILQAAPPVLVDIGASGKIHDKWEKIAKYSICVAFDADDREFGYVVKENSGYKKLYIYNCIVSNSNNSKEKFYLAKSPYCSSLLEPDSESLKKYSFAEKFVVVQESKIETKKLMDVLNELKIDKVDWFKTDSQGTDLRLFLDLDEQIRLKTLIAEFEPGIIDAYKNEDKLYKILEYLNSNAYWVSDINVKGAARISSKYLDSISYNSLHHKLFEHSLKISPGWAEITFINTFEKSFELRDYLLGWVISTLQEQHGFAAELSAIALEKFNEPLLEKMNQYSIRRMNYRILKLKFLHPLIKNLF